MNISPNISNNNNTFIISKLFSFRWIRILFLTIILIILFLIFRQISDKIFLLLITCLPLFLGFAFSYIAKPFISFLNKFFSEKISKILSFFFISSLCIFLFAGILILFLFQLNNLYNFLVKKIPNDELLQEFFEKIKNGKITQTNLNKINLESSVILEEPSWTFGYSIIGSNEYLETNFKKTELSGIFILLIKAISWTYLKSLSLKLMPFFYNISKEGYWTYFWSYIDIILMLMYIFIFSLFIAAFSIGKGQKFYSKIWLFLTKEQSVELREELSFELKKNLKSWSKGLFFEQIYIFLGTGLFIFLAGIIWKNSGFLESIFALVIIMGIFNLIPYIGPWIGIIPIVGLGISHVIATDINSFNNWMPFIVAVCGTILIQIGQSVLISPIVYSRQLKIGPVTIIMILSIFFVLFGMFSMIFALPIIIIIKTILKVIYKKEWNI